MTYRTKAIVLRSYSWPRHAKCFYLYTKEYGKVRAVAAGIQKIKSKVAGHLQPFTVSEVMLVNGRSMEKVAQARMERNFLAFGREYDLFLLGSYVLEVVERLTREGVADLFVWDELCAVLQELDDQGQWSADLAGDDQTRFSLITRLFALRLLDRYGYRPELRACVNCSDKLDPAKLSFSLLQGGLLCQSCVSQYLDTQPVSADCVKLLREALRLPIGSASRLLVSPLDTRLAITLIDQMLSVQLQEPLRTSRVVATVQEPSFFV